MGITGLWQRRARATAQVAAHATREAYGAERVALQAQINEQQRAIAALDERLRTIGRTVEARAELDAAGTQIKDDIAAIRKTITDLPRHHRR